MKCCISDTRDSAMECQSLEDVCVEVARSNKKNGKIKKKKRIKFDLIKT